MRGTAEYRIPPWAEPGPEGCRRALVAMSGGVDSSVAALLTREAGYEAIGVTMKLYDNALLGEEQEGSCCSLADVEDARSVCSRLGIRYYVFDFSREFQREVIDRFVKAYEEGATPNPCIDCNRYLKFERLFRRGTELGAEKIVTGHYVRSGFDAAAGRWYLKRGLDSKKDQSYVLYQLTQEQLAHCFFPLGELTKEEVREIAEAHGFVNAAKHDSQDICFVPDHDHAGFIRRYTGKDYPSGDFTDASGRVLGQHQGLIRYTIGQRKGLGLALKEPMYVIRKDVPENRVVLGRNEDLFQRELTAAGVNWVSLACPDGSVQAEVKIRYSQAAYPATVTPLAEDRVRIYFDEPQRAATRGQAAVFYDGDLVLGGGTIE